MLFIRGYYYFFAAFIFTIAGICQALSYINRFRFSWPKRQKMSYQNVLSLLHLDLGKM